MTESTQPSPQRFESLEDILAHVEAVDPQRVVARGGWTPAQVVEHVATLIEFSIDGFPFKGPAPLRLIGRLLKRHTLQRGIKPGIKFPRTFAPYLNPPADVTWTQALEHLCQLVQRLRRGETMDAPSPIFGPMTDPQWRALHCRHAELHFSFLAEE